MIVRKYTKTFETFETIISSVVSEEEIIAFCNRTGWSHSHKDNVKILKTYDFSDMMKGNEFIGKSLEECNKNETLASYFLHESDGSVKLKISLTSKDSSGIRMTDLYLAELHDKLFEDFKNVFN